MFVLGGAACLLPGLGPGRRQAVMRAQVGQSPAFTFHMLVVIMRRSQQKQQGGLAKQSALRLVNSGLEILHVVEMHRCGLVWPCKSGHIGKHGYQVRPGCMFYVQLCCPDKAGKLRYVAFSFSSPAGGLVSNGKSSGSLYWQ
ncbi:hypothetical protein [Thalassospira marina]|uniref:hypothetical protein n=1 Tax=Thalassospira marina TaxID=2048283 RepID=UPI001562DF6A|nr:hypothetical protein [Thalassospira marina]